MFFLVKRLGKGKFSKDLVGWFVFSNNSWVISRVWGLIYILFIFVVIIVGFERVNLFYVLYLLNSSGFNLLIVGFRRVKI